MTLFLATRVIATNRARIDDAGMPRYIVESYEAELSHNGKRLAGQRAEYESTIYLYELDLDADPKITGSWSGKTPETPRRAPNRECPWWVTKDAQAHAPGRPKYRSSYDPVE